MSTLIPYQMLDGVGIKNYVANSQFESNTTTSWSLGNAGTLTNNIPTGSPTFGSGASGNLSIATVSSSPLSGLYSLSLVSSSATTSADMLATDPFTIDISDQSKTLNFRFLYSPTVNSGNANWAGSSTNSFGVMIYDVTNSAWIAPSTTLGAFGMNQSSGVGVCSGTFTTSSNGTSYRLVIYNSNATSGSITVLFDDFYVGPTANLTGIASDGAGNLTIIGTINGNAVSGIGTVLALSKGFALP